MAFLRSNAASDTGPVVFGDGVVLRLPTHSDYAAWAELRAVSREHLSAWEPAWSRDELSRNAFRRRLRHYQKDLRDESGYAFFLFRSQDQALLGGLTLSNIRRGVTQSANLGYWLGAPFVGQGYMTRAVRGLIPFVFDVLKLHRLEAACIPTNAPSIGVLEKVGFRREGLARRYLKINGSWQDHFLYALLEDDIVSGAGAEEQCDS